LRAPLRPYPTPCGGACPAPATVAQPRAPSGCRPHWRTGAAHGVARQRPGCSGAGGGECWGGCGRRGGGGKVVGISSLFALLSSPSAHFFPHSTEFSGGMCPHSSKAARGENLQVEHPICGGYGTRPPSTSTPHWPACRVLYL